MIRAFVILAAAVIASGCITRAEIKASLWLNNGIPEEVCSREPSLRDHGFYRRLNDGKLEFISFCSPDASRWISIYDADLEKILDETLPDQP